ncbi:RIP metalloprotease RseP [Acidisphaera sp. L21]|uniref:RIP metalloprotease RseP n=1 Tax=Acidisphaera sp. L21 TaxID=1641851 RepID=UPI001575237A|nr:RIP metalloprotease RseP [Acidisphaera sp. L21]
MILPDALRTVISFLVVLGVLVFIHEMGHYLAARWRGVHVEAFSIGFGKPFARWTDRVGTEWRLCWLPLGGYVKLHGQERPEDVSDEVRAGWQHGRTFHEKSVVSRAIVVAAGPVANFLLAAVLFSVMFAIQGEPGDPVVQQVMANSPAASAGFKSGDHIVQINDRKINNFEDIVRIISVSPGKPLQVQILRDGAPATLAVVPASVDDGGGGKLGVLGIGGALRPVGPVGAVVDGVTHVWDVAVQTLVGVWQIIVGQRGTSGLGGPLKIAQLSGQVAQNGIGSLVSFIALLSVNLGLINLFPIPILDGGHLVFYALEALRGRPLPARAQEYGFRAGLALIACLFLFVTWNDLTSFGLFHWVAGLMG